MISVILYGRNDNHGYNYHKRLAISLNCIAEVLSDPQDEVIFADYNTPDDFPTIIEAIQDTLTQKAKNLIRILRIRPRYHRLFKKTHLPILETVARNVAIRRSNPENKWILSTNPDMVFIPLDSNNSLTNIIAHLPDGFYSLPRFALPEGFWELALERSNPQQNLSFLKEQNRKFHLNTTVRRPGFLQYDNPGDFQLMLRMDIFQIGGFDEEMVKGWHVDSNLCKRMSLLGRTGESLEKRLIAFHCNHNQKESLIHKKIAENNWGRFVSHVTTPELSNQDWGLPKQIIEEIRLKNRHIPAISSTLSHSVEKDYEVLIHLDSFNTLTYAPSRIFTYLADHFCHFPKTIHIAYVGHNTALLNMLNCYLDEGGFSGKILCLKDFLDAHEKLPHSAVLSEMKEMLSEAFLFICDFGFDENSPIGKSIKENYSFGRKKLKKVMNAFFEIINKKKALKKDAKFIGINILHTDFNVIFSRHLLIRNNSYSPGVCYGYLPQKNKTNRRKFISTLHYLVARYFFDYSDQIRSFFARTKISKKLFKGSLS